MATMVGIGITMGMPIRVYGSVSSLYFDAPAGASTDSVAQFISGLEAAMDDGSTHDWQCYAHVQLTVTVLIRMRMQRQVAMAVSY